MDSLLKTPTATEAMLLMQQERIDALESALTKLEAEHAVTKQLVRNLGIGFALKDTEDRQRFSKIFMELAVMLGGPVDDEDEDEE